MMSRAEKILAGVFSTLAGYTLFITFQILEVFPFLWAGLGSIERFVGITLSNYVYLGFVLLVVVSLIVYKYLKAQGYEKKNLSVMPIFATSLFDDIARQIEAVREVIETGIKWVNVERLIGVIIVLAFLYAIKNTVKKLFRQEKNKFAYAVLFFLGLALAYFDVVWGYVIVSLFILVALFMFVKRVRKWRKKD